MTLQTTFDRPEVTHTDQQKQYFIDTDCDNGVKYFNTTSGSIKRVRLELVADDGSCYIRLKSYGTYRIKIGYNYSILDDGEITKVLKKYHTEEDELNYEDDISISNGPYADLDDDEKECLSDDEIRHAYPMKIDIIELVHLGSKKKVK
jgi:hypothetical protein